MSYFNFLLYISLYRLSHIHAQDTQKFNLPMTRKNLVFFQSCTVFLSQLFVQMEFRALCVTLDQTCSAILSFSIFYMYKVNIPGNYTTKAQSNHSAQTMYFFMKYAKIYMKF